MPYAYQDHQIFYRNNQEFGIDSCSHFSQPNIQSLDIRRINLK